MNFVNQFRTSTGNETNPQSQAQPNQQGGGFMSSVNEGLGGGQAGERKEDMLDKGVDMFQEKVMGTGPQNNESALEQAKDERISDGIRSAYHGVMGKDFPVADKS